MTSPYRPKLFTTESGYRTSVWVKMPSGESFSIGYMDKKLVPDKVMKLIATAFERGYLAHVEKARQVQDWVQVEIEAVEK